MSVLVSVAPRRVSAALLARCKARVSLSTAAKQSPEPVAPTAYSTLLSTMHWLTAPALLGCVGTVLYAQKLKGEEKGAWMFRHKSLGLLSAILIGPRVYARLSSKAPGGLPGSSALEHIAGNLSHYVLYAFMFVMPATGIAMGYYSGKGLPFFWTTVPGAAKPDGAIAKQAFGVHKLVGTYGKFLLPVHVGAAGFHAAKGQAIFARINPFK